MMYSLSGYDGIGYRMTEGVALGYSKYSPPGYYWRTCNTIRAHNRHLPKELYDGLYINKPRSGRHKIAQGATLCDNGIPTICEP